MAGEVVDLLDRDAEVKQPRDKGVAEIMGPDVAEGRSFACRTKAFADGGIGDDPVADSATVFAYFAAAVVVGIGALATFYSAPSAWEAMSVSLVARLQLRASCNWLTYFVLEPFD